MTSDVQEMTNTLRVFGEQVLSLWKPIFEMNLQIDFGYTSFEWNNNAKNKAHVIVVIIGLSNYSSTKKKLFTDDSVIFCDNINGYLSNGRNVFVDNRREPITPLFNTMVYGSEPREGGFLMLDPYERECIENENPDHLIFVKRTVGSNEYINGIPIIRSWNVWRNVWSKPSLLSIPQE